MKLIAESGSTRTEWALVEDNRLVQRVFTEGLNPFFQTRREISRSVRLGLPESFFKRKLEAILLRRSSGSSLSRLLQTGIFPITTSVLMVQRRYLRGSPMLLRVGYVQNRSRAICLTLSAKFLQTRSTKRAGWRRVMTCTLCTMNGWLFQESRTKNHATLPRLFLGSVSVGTLRPRWDKGVIGLASPISMGLSVRAR